MSLAPSDPPGEIVAQRTEFKPLDRRDPPSRWRRFVDFLRVNIGLKPLHLAERWAEAKVFNEEVEAQAKLYQAKAEYEKVLAEAHRIERESKAKAEKDEAEAKRLRAQARQEAADARIREKAARLMEASNLSPQEAIERLLAIREQLELLHGGRAEFQLPEPSDEDEGAERPGG